MPYAELDDIELYYEVTGEGDPVLLIGGLGSQIHSWATQVPIYSREFRVITFDNRGAGRSGKPGGAYSIEQMADDTVSLLDHLGIEKASFVGKSMGGMIAQWIGIKYPERVTRLVMGCSSASRDEIGNMILETGREIGKKVGMRTLWLMALFMGYSREYIESNLESIKDTMSNIPQESPEALRGYIGQSTACQNHDLTDRLHLISARTLVMYGEMDFIASPRRSAELGDLIPDSVVRPFPDVGHGFWRERQKEADKLVMDFLRGKL